MKRAVKRKLEVQICNEMDNTAGTVVDGGRRRSY